MSTTNYILLFFTLVAVVCGREEGGSVHHYTSNETEISLVLKDLKAESWNLSAVQEHSRQTFYGINHGSHRHEQRHQQRKNPQLESRNNETSNNSSEEIESTGLMKQPGLSNLTAERNNTKENISEFLVGEQRSNIPSLHSQSMSNINNVPNSTYSTTVRTNVNNYSLQNTTFESSVARKFMNVEDLLQLLFKEDAELNNTLTKAWNETEHFLTSGDLEIGQGALELLRTYIDKRHGWLRYTKTLLLNKNILSDSSANNTVSLVDREDQLSEVETCLNKLENIHKLASFVDHMHQFDVSQTHNKTGIAFLVNDAERYLKVLETALKDLEHVWEGFNVSGYYIFPWDHPHHLVNEKKNLTTMNNNTSNSNRKFAGLEEAVRYYTYPIVYIIILILGGIGNGTLLVMFARHKEIRTGPNIMVFNLAITDVLNLLLNTPLYYVSKYHGHWIYLGGYGCKSFVTFRFVIHSVLAFSIVALSAQRYCATVQTLRKARARWDVSAWLRTTLYILAVWIIALLFALPTAIVFEYKNGICFPFAKNKVAVKALDILYFFLYVFVLPGAMLFFSLFTATRLKKSVKHIPGVIRNNNQEVARHRSAKVVTSLAIAYCVSHIPRSVWFFCVTFLHIDRKGRVIYILIDEISNYLMFSNSCLNPLALYFASGMFKRLFKMYLWRKVPTSSRKIAPLSKQNTASSTGRLMSNIVTFSSSELGNSRSSVLSIEKTDSKDNVQVKPSIYK